MASAPVDIGTLIEALPGVNGGKPCVASAGVSVHALAILSAAGRTPEQIVDSYPGLTLAGVHAALAYYHANRERIDGEIEAESELGRKMARRFPAGVGRTDTPGIRSLLDE